jgi:hypothetical protein
VAFAQTYGLGMVGGVVGVMILKRSIRAVPIAGVMVAPFLGEHGCLPEVLSLVRASSCDVGMLLDVLISLSGSTCQRNTAPECMPGDVDIKLHEPAESSEVRTASNHHQLHCMLVRWLVTCCTVACMHTGITAC